ncbi:MAG: DNA topoisomerase IB [Bryobacteraceae bacterium]
MASTAILSTDPLESAVAAGLRYVSGGGPCILRRRRGKGFCYVDPRGRVVRDPQVLKRIRALVIPPAWSNVWICPSPHGHLQAVGRDAKGRKQYRYHALYRQVRDQAKFSRMIAFGTVLARVRKRVQEDLARPGLPKEKVIATVVRLLETTYIRVGNEEYAKDNESFGLTTMRTRHVRVEGATLRFHFRGKSGQTHDIALSDQRLARIVKQCQELPGYELFQYVDDFGQRCRLDSEDVNRYLREITGQDFTAKDFRTWAGTVLAARELVSCGPAPNQTESKRNVAGAVKRVAGRLGNRAATCRKYYIHPAVLDGYDDGSLFAMMREGDAQNEAYAGLGLRPEEYCVMVLIAEYQQNLVKKARHAA